MLSFYLKYFPGNIFLNVFVFTMTDFFSNLIAAILLKNTSIKATYLFAHGVSFVGALLYIIFH